MKSGFSRPVTRVMVYVVLVLTAGAHCISCSREQSDVDDEPNSSAESNLKGTPRFSEENAKDKEEHQQVEPSTVPAELGSRRK